MNPSVKITLYRSAHNKIIALPGGVGHEWADIYLAISGFTRHPDGLHTLSLDDPSLAHASLTALHQTSRDSNVVITTHQRPYLGDVAEAIVAALPGHWMAAVEPLRQQQDQHHLRDYLWETGSIYYLLEKNQLGVAAILRDGAGTELLLIERPSDGSYMVGALTPSPDHVHVTASAPRSVIASDAGIAARFIQTRLLPDYARAVHLSRLYEAEQDLRWAQELEPGTSNTAGMEAALYRFRIHATAFIATLRETKPLSAEQTIFLDRMEDGLNLDELDDLDPEALADAGAVWLIDGEELIEMARARTLPASATPAQPTALPTTTLPAPAAAAPAPGSRR